MLIKLVNFMCIFTIAMFVSCILLVCLFTPEKTKNGSYTDVYNYWTSDAYLCQNFDAKCENNRIVEK